VSAGPRAAEDLLPKPRNSLLKRFHGQHEVVGPVQRTVMSDLTVDSSCAGRGLTEGRGGYVEGLGALECGRTSACGSNAKAGRSRVRRCPSSRNMTLVFDSLPNKK
jgi:hypothetical protein